MAVRYGVADSYSCGARTVTYQPDGCVTCLPIKLGEKQIFEVDFSGEVRCNPVRIGCRYDYDELVQVLNFNSLPETVFGAGTIQVSVQGTDERAGTVQILVDATDPTLNPDEKWAINITVELESGRCLKQCFQIRTIPCGSACSVADEASACCGPILASFIDISSGTLFLYDEAPAGVVCAEITVTCDAFYTLDGSDPTDSNSVRIPVLAGFPVKLLNAQDVQNFRMAAADCSCECSFTRVYRGADN